jgi:uncharacterized protein
VSPLLVSAERSLAAEFPDTAMAAQVLSAIGSGERTFTNIAKAAGGTPVARRLLFLGSMKWLERSPFDDHDLVALHRHRSALTDEPLPLLAVSRSGVTAGGLAAAYGPEELIRAWD